MASLRDIKRRIGSVKSTQKITNAMKLVSASKFAKASHAVQAARPYGEAFNRMVANLLAADSGEISSPLIEVRDERKVLVVIVGTDRGLCGGLNANVFKKAGSFIDEQLGKNVKVGIAAWGRRSISFSKRYENQPVQELEKVLENANPAYAVERAQDLIKQFSDGDWDAVYIVFPRFKSALDQEPTLKKILPLTLDTGEGSDATEEAADAGSYIIEPGIAEMITPLLSRVVMQTIFNALLEGAASEHGARMTAMDSATNNAKDVTKKLTLVYNRARQAAITTELTEIISGAEALN